MSATRKFTNRELLKEAARCLAILEVPFTIDSEQEFPPKNVMDSQKRALSKKCHTDKQTDDKNNILEINSAYDFLAANYIKIAAAILETRHAKHVKETVTQGSHRPLVIDAYGHSYQGQVVATQLFAKKKTSQAKKKTPTGEPQAQASQKNNVSSQSQSTASSSTATPNENQIKDIKNKVKKFAEWHNYFYTEQAKKKLTQETDQNYQQQLQNFITDINQLQGEAQSKRINEAWTSIIGNMAMTTIGQAAFLHAMSGGAHHIGQKDPFASRPTLR